MPLTIWIDADACPKVIKEILYRAAERVKVKTILVANQWLTIPKSPYIFFVQVGQGFDVADNHIVQNLEAGDLVITADVPLASEVIQKNGVALNPRGTFYTKANIGANEGKKLKINQEIDILKINKNINQRKIDYLNIKIENIRVIKGTNFD